MKKIVIIFMFLLLFNTIYGETLEMNTNLFNKFRELKSHISKEIKYINETVVKLDSLITKEINKTEKEIYIKSLEFYKTIIEIDIEVSSYIKHQNAESVDKLFIMKDRIETLRNSILELIKKSEIKDEFIDSLYKRIDKETFVEMKILEINFEMFPPMRPF